MLTGVIDSDCQGEIGLLLYNRGKEFYIWNSGDLLGPVFLVLPYPVTEVNEKLQ